MKKIFAEILLLFSMFSVSVFADTNQDEINQVLSIFRSYKLNYADYYDSNSTRVKQYNPNHYDISYFVYDNRGWEFTIWFNKGPWYEHPEGQSSITIGTIGKASSKSAQRVNNMRESIEGVQAHLPVQEFINMVRADSRVAVSGSSNSQQYAQTQQQSTQTQGYNVMPELKSQSTQNRSQSSSSYAKIKSDELGVVDDMEWGLRVAIAVLFLLAVCIPWLSVSVRRLHDANHSGWWNLLLLVFPFIPIVFYFFDSYPQENKWGANPKQGA